MSDSIHITTKDFRNLPKREIDEMLKDPNSLLRQWGRKSNLKKAIKKVRKAKKTDL